VTTRTPAKKSAAKPLDEDDVVEEAAPAPSGKVVFVPNQHASGVQTPSGAVFTFSPQVAVKLSRTDAEDLVSTGFGIIQGG
jgi:hypothetical protein